MFEKNLKIINNLMLRQAWTGGQIDRQTDWMGVKKEGSIKADFQALSRQFPGNIHVDSGNILADSRQ